MNFKKNRLLLGLSLGTALAASPMASNAAGLMLTNNWQLDFSALGGGGNYKNIDGLSFGFSPYHVVINDIGNNGLNPGDTFTVEGKGTISSFLSGGGSVTPLGLNAGSPGGAIDPGGFQITYAFSGVGGIFTGVSGDSLTFEHNNTGTLNWYYDNAAIANTFADAATGTGFTDGTQWASFNASLNALASIGLVDGGVFAVATGDGADDVTFVLASPPVNAVLKDSSGSPFAPGNAWIHIDSNLDGSPAGGDPFSYQTGGFACGKTALDSCGFEDGSVVLASSVPEPASLVLLGIGLSVFGFARRKSQVR